MSQASAEENQVSGLKPKTTHCYVCGPKNHSGLHVTYVPDGDTGAKALYTAREEHSGWPGILHGGLTFTLMDEALGWALYFRDLAGVTARIETRFREPITVGTQMFVRAWMIDRRRKIITAKAEVRRDSADGAILAEADATMYLVDDLA
jgi:acyl-coenzyme A thioesterase PaaI-like protein